MSHTKAQPASYLRFPALVLAVIGGLAAMWAGLAWSGWKLPLASGNLLISHGPLMVGGFLATVISLERAVATEKPWVYLAPLLAGAATIVLLVIGPNQTSALLYAVSGGVIAMLFALSWNSNRETHTAVLLTGAVLWVGGSLFWAMRWPIFTIVYWWEGFLVLTIAGERLELARLMKLPGMARPLFLGAAILYTSGIIISILVPEVGVRMVGAGQIALAGWLLTYDMTRRTIRQAGMPRYIAFGLIIGYLWLGVSGLLAIAFGAVTPGLLYDALLHTLFVGFVISMIFGHGPIILPAILKRPFSYLPILYGPLALLHISVIIRVVGDLISQTLLRQTGGLLNAIAVLLFAVCMVAGLVRGRQAENRSQDGR